MDKLEVLLAEYKPKGKEYAENTKRDYRNAFRILAGVFETEDFDTLFKENYEHVITVLQERYGSNGYWYKVNTYCKFYNIPYREIPLIENDRSKIPVYDMNKIRERISRIRELKPKVFLSLLANTIDYSVRRDWATVMITEYCTESEIESAKALYTMKTGKFKFIELNKTGRSLEFVIEDSTKELLDEYIPELKDPRYLYNYNTKEVPTDNKRTNSFSHFLDRITSKYLGKKMSVNDFRKGMETESVDKAIKSKDPNAFHKFMDSVAKKDHSITTSLTYYINDSREAESQSEESMEVTLMEVHPEVTEEIQPEIQQESLTDTIATVSLEFHENLINTILTLVKLGKSVDEIKVFLNIH
jgi:hypothetical protein